MPDALLLRRLHSHFKNYLPWIIYRFIDQYMYMSWREICRPHSQHLTTHGNHPMSLQRTERCNALEINSLTQVSPCPSRSRFPSSKRCTATTHRFQWKRGTRSFHLPHSLHLLKRKKLQLRKVPGRCKEGSSGRNLSSSVDTKEKFQEQ
jgi:hypothetical protein